MFATQVLTKNVSDDDLEEDNESEVVGYLIIKEKKYEVKKGETKIGRESSMCSIVIENFTVSKVHAVIESEGVDDTFIYDNGSTNQTKLGKKVLKPHCRYKLDDDSKLTIGNITATFTLPPNKSSNSSAETNKSNQGNTNLLDEFGDIFDLATQVNTPDTSAKIPVFEKPPENRFKVPTLVLPAKASSSVFDEVTQCRLNSEETSSRTVVRKSAFESSNIFNISTQCQLYEENDNDCFQKEEEDKVKSLLNDGQDDVLCGFMSLHSPKERNDDEIKAELFDAPTQIQPVIGKQKAKVIQSIYNNVKEDTPSPQLLEEEDFIKTQEFDRKGGQSVSENLKSYADDTIADLSRIENDEDLILTQVFDALESRVETTKSTVDEDHMETQIYDVEKEVLGGGVTSTPLKPLFKAEGVETLNATQRDNQDDFIETQVFEEMTDRRKKDKNLERDKDSANEEDFIATQLVDIPVNNSQNIPETREGSPDLLGFESAEKDKEDFIVTQLFDAPERQTNKLISSHAKERNDSEIAQSSGDETESDLEIILEKTETKSFKTEPEPENTTQPRNIETEEDNSNSSYIFEPALENRTVEASELVSHEEKRTANLSDSDETDCEELAVVALNHRVKQEPLERAEFEETQVLTLTLPNNYQGSTIDDVWMNGDLEESPKFESGIENGPRSPHLSNVKTENENGVVEDYQTPSKIKKIEVGVSKLGREADSPLKRPLDSKDPDVVPVKKSKTDDRLLKSTEKKLLKLVQAHDIAQIQPSRTRNSIKMLATENKPNETDISVTNEHQSYRNAPKRQKINGDITSYLTNRKVVTRRTSYRERTMETKVEPQPVESSSRVLRSSRRSNGIGVENEAPPIRRSRRISRTKSNEYFTSSCVNVVFTGFSCESLDKIISELGGKKANDLSCGEVVVADKVRRTVKFLCAIGLGLPITSPEWLQSCKRERKFLNPWNFILKDEESEERYNFELKTSLERSKRVKLLEGFSIFATKSAKPPVKELLAIVESCGGTPIHNAPDVWPKKTIIVSCLEDKQWWPLEKFRNIKIVHYEFILGGVLRQKIDFKTYRLR